MHETAHAVSSAPEPILALHGITAAYGATVALRGVSLEVRQGEVVAVLGPTGAGKTTTLKTALGLVRARQGRVVFEGEDITGLSTESIVGRGLALSPEGRKVFGRLTVYENLRLGAGLRGQRRLGAHYAEVVELFPVLARKRDDFAGLLSGGEQQQLAIARALMSRPKVLLLDEPSLGLAPIVMTAVFSLIERLRDRGMTIVLVEQNVTRALELAARGYVLRTGQVELSGTVAELRDGSAIEESYLGLGAEGPT
jgi:branched-chain amino acid transport system ATP-binding protein